ncbi:MAG: prefoldin subunit [Nanoarchaeota archaeon]
MKQETEQKIGQLQLIEQNLQNFLGQKQQIQSQLLGIESAERELKATKKAYKIIGNIMISKEKDELEQELREKREKIELRLKTIEKQEEKNKTRVKELQEEVMKDIEHDEETPPHEHAHPRGHKQEDL